MSFFSKVRRFLKGPKKPTPVLNMSRNRKSLDSSKLLFLYYLSTFTLIGILAGLFSLVILFSYYARDLPNPNKLIERNTDLSTVFYDRNGKQLYEFHGEKNRSLIALDKVSENIIHATLAAEDADFYTHKGFSIRGILRAVKNMVVGGGLQSGSTLTQQVVKNGLLTQARTLSRKISELILSLELENKYSKDQILQMYLNETPYGGQNYGILTAAKAYFDKDPSQLDVAEAAYLAGLPQRPTYYSHFGATPEAGIARKDYVLYLMNVRGWIGADGQKYFLSDEEYKKAKSEELHFQSGSFPQFAPHFVFYVKQLLADKFGEAVVEQGGLQVTTSLDLDLQNKAQQTVFDEVEKAKYLNVGNGALIAIDPRTGQILAMVGSKGYNIPSEPAGCISGTTGPNSCTFEPFLNVITAKRQPGSTIKPITYAAMLSQGYTAGFPFLDVPTTFPGPTPDKPYKPENYDGKFRGPISLRKALGNSINIPAVKALKIVSIDTMISFSQQLGITTLNDRSRYGLALTLGGGETKLLEMTDAFATFADKGVYHEPTAILEVKDSKGNLIYKWHDTGGSKVLGEDISFLISDILSDDGARSDIFGSGSLLNIPGKKVAVKTGTTDDKRDNYAIGYTPSIAVGVWVGNNNNDKMNPILASGITGATPIWHDFMTDYLKDKKSEPFTPPANVQKITIDALTGMQPYENNPSRLEWFIQGTEPTAKSNWYQRVEICKVDKKIANDSCRKADKTKINNYIKMTAELPEWQPDVDKWVQDHYGDESKYFPPVSESKLVFDDSGDVQSSDNVYVDITGFKDGDSAPLSFRFAVEPSASNSIDKVNIYLDGNQVTSDGSEPYGYNFLFKPEDAGSHEFKAVAVDSKGNEGEKTIKLNIVASNDTGVVGE